MGDERMSSETLLNIFKKVKSPQTAFIILAIMVAALVLLLILTILTIRKKGQQEELYRDCMTDESLLKIETLFKSKETKEMHEAIINKERENKTKALFDAAERFRNGGDAS